MPLINCEISLFFTWSENCILTDSTEDSKLAITTFVTPFTLFPRPLQELQQLELWEPPTAPPTEGSYHNLAVLKFGSKKRK